MRNDWFPLALNISLSRIEMNFEQAALLSAVLGENKSFKIFFGPESC